MAVLCLRLASADCLRLHQGCSKCTKDAPDAPPPPTAHLYCIVAIQSLRHLLAPKPSRPSLSLGSSLLVRHLILILSSLPRLECRRPTDRPTPICFLPLDLKLNFVTIVYLSECHALSIRSAFACMPHMSTLLSAPCAAARSNAPTCPRQDPSVRCCCR